MSADELRRAVKILNSRGLHARPCHALVSTALEYDAELRVGYGGRLVNGKSILELMTLQAACGAELCLEALGEDAAEMLERLARLIESGFGESA